MPEDVNFNSSFSKGSHKTTALPSSKGIRKADALHEYTSKPNHSKTLQLKNKMQNK